MTVREKQVGAPSGRVDVRLWLRLLSCSMIIEKRLRRRFAEQFDTTLPRFDVLAALDRQGEGMTMSELSRALLVSNGNVTALVRQLERAGHVVSRSAPEDRRSSIVMLTPEGAKHFATLAKSHHAWIGKMFKGLDGGDQVELYRLLDSLKRSIAADADEAG